MKSIDRLVTGLASELNIDSGARNQARRAWHYLATDTGNLYEILEDNVTLIGTLTLNAPKVYVALLTQTGTAAPVATVLQNTLGGTVVWTRVQAGEYRATLAGAFVTNKTVLPPFGTDYAGNMYQVIPFQNGAATPSGYYSLERGNENLLTLSVFDDSLGLTEWSTLLDATPIFVEIRVYP